MLSRRHDGELIVVDAEHNLTLISALFFSVKNTFVGHNHEILDLRVNPVPASSNDADEDDDGSAKSTCQRTAVATKIAQVRLFHLGTFSCQVLDGHTDTVLVLEVSLFGRFLVSCGKDKMMRLWHMRQQVHRHYFWTYEAIGATALSRKAVNIKSVERKKKRSRIVCFD